MRLKQLEGPDKVIEHERLKRRVRQDVAMIKEFGYCNGIKNYSRHFDRRSPGEPPYTLLSYFPKDFFDGDRRVARDDPADRRHVRGRSRAQGNVDPIRHSIAECLGQSSAKVRRISKTSWTDYLYVSDARRLRARAQRRAAFPKSFVRQGLSILRLSFGR